MPLRRGEDGRELFAARSVLVPGVVLVLIYRADVFLYSVLLCWWPDGLPCRVVCYLSGAFTTIIIAVDQEAFFYPIRLWCFLLYTGICYRVVNQVQSLYGSV